MALFHMRAQVISRSAGRSAIAAAAYRAGERLRDERTGQMHDYSRKAYVEHREIMAPETAPGWMRDRAALWSAVEAAEKRKDAQLAREVHFALPRELEASQRVELIRDFCQSEFVARGMIADVAIHNPSGRDGGEQPHAHVMLTTRVLTGEGFGSKERSWNDKALYEGWRERWADHANRSLERIGSGERIDHRSFAGRGIDREPEPKLGPKAARLERVAQRDAANENRPVVAVTERGQEWQAVQERNRRRDELRARVEVVARGLQQVAERALAEARARLEAVRERFDRAATMIRDWVGRERTDAASGKIVRPTVAEPDRLKAESPPVRAAPAERDRLFGREAAQAPDHGRSPAEPSRAESPSRDKLLGRGGQAREDADREKAVGDGSGRDARQPGKPVPVDRDALFGKTTLPTPTRLIPTPADLLGRGPLQNTPQLPGRDKDGGRER